GRVSGSDLAQVYRDAWVFCLPSSYEGFGVPYIEAMACGTPVIATPNGGAEDVLGGGAFGVLASEGDLGGALVSVLQSSEQRAALTARALERARDYAIDRMAEKYEAVYDAVIQAQHARAFSRAVPTR